MEQFGSLVEEISLCSLSSSCAVDVLDVWHQGRWTRQWNTARSVDASWLPWHHWLVAVFCL